MTVADPKRAMPPIAIVGEPRSDGRAEPERDYWMRIENRSIDEHHVGLIVGDVYYIGLGRDDPNDLRFGDNLLLWGVDQRAGGAGFGAQRLNHLHDVR